MDSVQRRKTLGSGTSLRHIPSWSAKKTHFGFYVYIGVQHANSSNGSYFTANQARRFKAEQDLRQRYLVRLRRPHTVRVYERATGHLLHRLKSAGPIRSLFAGPAYSSGRLFFTIWLQLADARTEIYSAASGRLLETRPNPSTDPRVQAALRRWDRRSNDPMRYAVIFTVSKRSNGFYDFAEGRWEWNAIPERGLFKERAVAEAAAAALTKLRRSGSTGSLIFSSRSRRLLTVALKRTPNGFRLMEAVTARAGRYIPTLPRRNARLD